MSKPELPVGYLGPQGTWKELELSCVNHRNPEFATDQSRIEVQLMMKKRVKVTANLIEVATDKEYKEQIFTQTLDDVIYLVVALPNAGYFKLQIYALLAKDESTSFPNVFNYLIHSKTAPSGAQKAFPKQFAQWKDGCYLHEPFSLRNQDSATFRVTVPEAKAVALTVADEWFTFNQKRVGGPWHGQATGLLAFKDAKKAALCANYSPEGNKYTSLLEYEL